MDKTKVYSKTGRILLSVWVITWAILICKFSIPYKGFNNFMASTGFESLRFCRSATIRFNCAKEAS